MEHEEAASPFNIHPMDQFEVWPLFGGEAVHWYTLTNATLWMALVVIAASLLLVAGSRGRALVPSRAARAPGTSPTS
jgi:F-type H+-transporting ATPase subunit a